MPEITIPEILIDHPEIATDSHVEEILEALMKGKGYDTIRNDPNIRVGNKRIQNYRTILEEYGYIFLLKGRPKKKLPKAKVKKPQTEKQEEKEDTTDLIEFEFKSLAQERGSNVDVIYNQLIISKLKDFTLWEIQSLLEKKKQLFSLYQVRNASNILIAKGLIQRTPKKRNRRAVYQLPITKL